MPNRMGQPSALAIKCNNKFGSSSLQFPRVAPVRWHARNLISWHLTLNIASGAAAVISLCFRFAFYVIFQLIKRTQTFRHSKLCAIKFGITFN